jgi:hypothetical protein
MIKLRTGGRDCITKHGYATRENRHPLYGRWKGMVQRCYDPSAASYRNYGAKNIGVCAAWLDFKNFLDWWLTQTLATTDKVELHRKDSTKDYSPDNCEILPLSEHRTLSKSLRVRCVTTGKEYADCQLAALDNNLGRNSVSRAIRLRYGKIKDLQFVLCEPAPNT